MWLDGALLTSAFLATYARAEAGWPEDIVTRLGMVMVAGQAGASLLLGWMSGRKGGGATGFLAAQLFTRAVLMAVLAAAALGPAMPAAVLLALAAGLLSASDIVVHPNVLLELGPRHARTDLMTLGTLVLTPTLMVVPPAAGLAIGFFGHRPVFIFAAAAGLAGLWLLLGLRRSMKRAAM
jgi:hypothetical protein